MKRNGINEICKVCEAVLTLQDSDFAEIQELYKGQKDYCHPLKNATAKRQNELGEHNEKVVQALKALLETIKLGENI